MMKLFWDWGGDTILMRGGIDKGGCKGRNYEGKAVSRAGQHLT